MRGPVDDVLTRFRMVLDAYPGDIMARFTSDCPMLDPAVAATAVGLLVSDPSLDCVTTVIPKTLPRGLDAEAQERAIAQWIDAEKHRAFELERAGLLRVHVHRRSHETFNLTLSFHHAILDGWSVASLLTELLTHYARRLDGQDSASEVLAVAPASAPAYRDYIALERRAAAAAAAAARALPCHGGRVDAPGGLAHCHWAAPGGAWAH